jgi:hypothetical protein
MIHNNPVLTKFSKFYPGMFGRNSGLKLSFPEEFNDIVDAQIPLTDDDIQGLTEKLSPLSAIRNFKLDRVSKQAINYYKERLETIHILSLCAKNCLDISTSNMWGIYADNGAGLAFEFDHHEMHDWLNLTSLKKSIGLILSTPKLLIDEIKKSNYVRELVRVATLNNEQAQKLLSENYISENEINYLNNIYYQEIERNIRSIFDLSDYLLPVSYKSDFRFLPNLFETFIRHMLTPSGDNSQFEDYIISNRTQIIVMLTNMLFTNKHNIWQHEHEYRLLYFKTSAKKIDEIEAKYEFNKDNPKPNFDDMIKELKEFRKLNKEHIRILPFNKRFEFQECGEYLHIINIPFPKKIYLGYNFKSDLCAIKSFCKNNLAT